MQFLRQQLHNLEDKMESEKEALSKKFQDERAGLEEELACAIREELQVGSLVHRSFHWNSLSVKLIFSPHAFTIETQRKTEADGQAGDD